MKSLAIQNAQSTSRLPLISAWRSLNTALDFVFYDTGALTQEERARLSAQFTPEGCIVVVYPRAADTDIRILTPLKFVEEQISGIPDPVDAVAIAGVGSSSVGTASLARDVADYLGRPVAGIVSGLGVSDVITEALGGWFVLGFQNSVRDALARTLHVLGFNDHVRDQPSHDDMRKHFEELEVDPEWFIYGSPDSTALLYLLSRLPSKLKLLVGHSKGNYSIENALEGFHRLSEASHTSIPSNLQIVTLGAVIWFGSEYAHVHQFIGQLDAFGIMNSRPDVNHVVVPGAWHSLNNALPGHVSVAQALKLAGVRPGGLLAQIRGDRAASRAGPS